MSTLADRKKAFLEHMHKVSGFVILVWGPGDSARKSRDPEKRRTYKKRADIRAVLRQSFPNAEVLFSEDPEAQKTTKGLGLDVLTEESVQAYLADLVILLPTSRGAQLEFDTFMTSGWFRNKVHVFLPVKYKNTSGLIKVNLDRLGAHQIDWFTERQFNDCTLAKSMAVKAALVAVVKQAISSTP